MPDDNPVQSALGSAGVDPRLPPPERRRHGDGGARRERRERRRSRRRASPEECERARRELRVEIERGSAVLDRLGHRVRLELVPGYDGAPDRVAVCFPGGAELGERCVTRTVRLRELQQWLARLEGLEGLVIDTRR